MQGSLKFEGRKFKDFSAHKLFGAIEEVPLIPLGRLERLKSLNLPVIYQGDQPNCVSCAVTFFKQWQEATGEALSEQFLAIQSGTGTNGNVPSKVLETARKIGIPPISEPNIITAEKHKISNYFYFTKFNQQILYSGLKDAPLIIGVEDWNGMKGGHMLVLLDVTEQGDWVVINWWTKGTQDIAIINKDFPIETAIGIGELPSNHTNKTIRLSMLDVIKSKVLNLWKKLGIKGKIGIGIIALLLAGIGVFQSTQYGTVGLIGKWSSNITVGLSSSDTSIPVSSVTLRDGEVFTSSNMQFPVYLTINSGNSTEEDVECTAFSGLTFTCPGRGLSWIGTAATSTSVSRAFAHAAGEKIMMSNTPYQYNRFAQIYASNLVTVSQNPLGKLVWSGSKMGWSDDGVNTFTFAAGSSGLNASTTKGIGISNSLIYVNASTTKGLAFDSSGKVYINASSTKYLKFSNGLLYWDSVGFLNATNLVTGKFEVPTPTVSSMATPKSYVDNGLLYGVATGTTSGTVSTGTAIYITPTGALAVTDTGAASSTFQFIGIANYTTSTGKTISYSQIGDTNCHLSGLKTGMWYYLSGSGGVLATTPVANKYARIGLAKSTTCLYITPPIYYTSGIQDATAATDYVIATGFYPAKITLYAASDNGGSKQGSIGSEANGSWQVQSGSSGYVYYDSGNAIYVADTGGGVIGTISARTSNSFTIHIATKTATNGANIRWMASSE